MRSNPGSSSGSWFSANGHSEDALFIGEAHSCAYDGVNNQVLCGFQDTGAAQQLDVDGLAAPVQLARADEGRRRQRRRGRLQRRARSCSANFALETSPAAPRITTPVDARGPAGGLNPNLVVAGTGGQTIYAFDATLATATPLAVNAVDDTRFVIGTYQVYEWIGGQSAAARAARA